MSYSPNQLTHMDLDASSTQKNGQWQYGYKAHVKCDANHQLIRSVETTTASVHDSQVHLEKNGDVAMWRDRAYAGAPLECGDGVKDKTMHKAARGHEVTKAQRAQNTLWSKVRCLGERPFAVIKRVFHAGHTNLKTLARVSMQTLLRCWSYNVYRAAGLIRAAA